MPIDINQLLRTVASRNRRYEEISSVLPNTKGIREMLKKVNPQAAYESRVGNMESLPEDKNAVPNRFMMRDYAGINYGTIGGQGQIYLNPQYATPRIVGHEFAHTEENYLNDNERSEINMLAKSSQPLNIRDLNRYQEEDYPSEIFAHALTLYREGDNGFSFLPKQLQDVIKSYELRTKYGILSDKQAITKGMVGK